MLPSFDALNGTLMPTTAETPVVGPHTPSSDEHPVDAGQGRFKVLWQHASGGLGRVSVALDNELHRHVALKEIHPELADHAECRARFLLEAEVTGSLEHPGVVPVYSLGSWHDGRPFYAMRLIRGKSLEEAVRQFHEVPCEAGERELRLRKLLRRFIDICNAVDYAHSRGVLHRDIKPANVMLGPYGETLVVDWGLAKPATSRDMPSGTAETWLAPQTAGNTPATRAGSVIGTPAYMGPEQAAGALDQLGPASDVYSLGATLYTVLTNRAPFEDENDFSVMRARILTGDFRRPREVKPNVPRPLEAICLKAMALEPGDRYVSASALAEDVENWLGDAPVRAYREGRVERLSRWSRRHRAWARAGAFSLVLVTLVALTASWLVNRARVQTEEAHHERAMAQIELLCNAEPAAIPLILENLRPFHNEVAPRLRELLAVGDLNPRQRMRLDLALLDDDATRVNDLVGSLLTCPYDDFPIVRDRLRSHVETFGDRLWQTLHDEQADVTARFHAGLALATYRPDSPRWTADDDAFLARTMLGEPVDQQPALRADLQPIAPRLLPEVYRSFGGAGHSGAVRDAATAALAVWAGGQTRLLATATSEASPERFAVLLPALAAARDRAVPVLREIVRRQPPSGGRVSEQERIALGRLRAGAAITLLRLDEDPLLGDLFTPADDPESRTQFVAGLRARGVEPAKLVACFDRAREVPVRFGLMLALGEFMLEEMPATDLDRLRPRLVDLYRTDPSSAIHSASGWLLARWQLAEEVSDFDHTPHSADFDLRREWFNVQVGLPISPGMIAKMIRFPAGEFLMGSPPTETDRQNQETQHRVRLTRPFAMSHRPVSRALYAQFLRDFRGPAAAEAYLALVKETTPMPTHPAVAVSWYDAVSFARWLTTETGMSEDDQCYADPATLALDGDGHPIERQWPFHPERRGFRLPTEAEWEYACRAGTVTAFSFGSDQSLAGDYGWTQNNSAGSSHQTLNLKPTGRGLVSMHGNVGEWCHDWLGFIPGGKGVDPMGAAGGPCRAIRGGSYLCVAALARSASRAGLPPEFAAPDAGVRLVCTLPE
ncbi:MAG TPA: bifunctional serine/threonine-protein kinase/formylglycine-generating enzyme family protein [Pirellulales bacterium]|nr:bifunctional serine/threonine-protein kinase/formylglycine-generating enzyme family protein [Pirellulales bacterium]